MERITADAAAIADTLEHITKSLRAPSMELQRRALNERARVRGYLAPQEREVPLCDILQTALHSRLAQLQELLPESMRQTDAVMRYLGALRTAPHADKYQTGRLVQLQREAALPQTLWLSDFVTYLWTHHCH